MLIFLEFVIVKTLRMSKLKSQVIQLKNTIQQQIQELNQNQNLFK